MNTEIEKKESKGFFNPRKMRFFLAIFIAGLIGYFIGVTKIDFQLKNFQPHVAFSSKEPPPSVTQSDFSKFWSILNLLEEKYYDKSAFDQQKILDGAISGMVDSLDDPYTLYLPPQQNDDFKQGLAGQFEGIGAELALKDKQIYVVKPLGGSPAQKAGIRIGDAIVKVDGESTAGWNVFKAVQVIRGEKGTSVTLTVLHKDDSELTDIKITRDTIEINSLTTEVKTINQFDQIDKMGVLDANKNNKIVYFKLTQFGDKTNDEWLKAINEVDMKIKSDSSIKGVVLDLRNNPGGYLGDAVYIASEFIENGNAVLQEDRNGKTNEFSVSGKGLLTDVPVVVLINKGSASASEIVSGALRDHKRAKLVGETSFGKGTIQEAAELGQGSGIHVTIAKWLTPNGTWVGNGKTGSGLKPDLEVKPDEQRPDHDIQLEKAIEELLK